MLGGDDLPAKNWLTEDSDPFVVVWWGSKLIGRTKIIFHTLKPRWSTETFIIPVDTLFDEFGGDNERASFTKYLRLEVLLFITSLLNYFCFQHHYIF